MKRDDLSSLLTISLVLFTKSAVIVKFVQAIKLLKVAKPLVMMISILISIISYGWLYGSWWFAAGLVLMIFIHEMGHVIALRKEGLPPSPMVFIPFLGAAIFVPEMKTRVTEARIGIGGPLLGTIGAVLAFFAWAIIPGEHNMLLLVSYVGIALNLFNLIPISPLDGGRITQICGSWFKYVGLAIVLALLFALKQPDIILIVVLVLDSFDRMPGFSRSIISGLLTITMIGLFIFGYSNMPLLLIVLDSILAIVFTASYYFRDLRRARGDEDDSITIYEDENQITDYLRLKWFVYWATLVVFLITILAIQVQYLPKEVLQNARLMAQ